MTALLWLVVLIGLPVLFVVIPIVLWLKANYGPYTTQTDALKWLIRYLLLIQTPAETHYRALRRHRRHFADKASAYREAMQSVERCHGWYTEHVKFKPAMVDQLVLLWVYAHAQYLKDMEKDTLRAAPRPIEFTAWVQQRRRVP